VINANIISDREYVANDAVLMSYLITIAYKHCFVVVTGSVVS